MLKIKNARKTVGLTQKALSEWLGIPRRTIEDWEREINHCPDWCERLLVEKIFSYKGDGKMRVFEVAEIELRGNEPGDEWQDYIGCDFEKAIASYNESCKNYSKMTERDKKSTSIEARVYTIDDSVDVTDADELNNALIDCIGYDLFAEKINS